MDKWLRMGSIQKTSENEVSTSVGIATGLACDKPNSCGETQWCQKVACQEKKV
jgi:hypothetical protein